MLQFPRRESTGRSTLIIALLALVIALASTMRPAPPHSAGFEPSALERIKRSGILRVGYGGFPPYTIVDLNEPESDRQVRGFCADLVQEIAQRAKPRWSIEWHKASWETLTSEMHSNVVDIFADVVYMTVPRASEFLFTRPISYFGVGVALVRSAETRFREPSDLNHPAITISLAEGWTSTEFAKTHLPFANLHIVPVGDEPFISFEDVLAGRADAALQDVPTVLQFARMHPAGAKVLWLDNPPQRVPAGFMVRRDDSDLKEFFDTAIDILEADGTIRRLDEKWKTLSEYPAPLFRNGRGLR